MGFAIVTGCILAIIGLTLGFAVRKWDVIALKLYVPASLLATCLIGCGIVSISYHCVAFSNEVWNTCIEKVSYYEPWTEKCHRTVTYQSGKTTKTRTETYYVHHSKYWTATDQYGSEYNVSQDRYSYWKNIWNNEKEVDIWRTNQSSFGDGDKHESYWTKEFDKMLPWSFVNHYENKIRAVNTVWKFADVDKETQKKFPRPADTDKLCPIITYGVYFSPDDEILLRRWNAVWGAKHQIHTIIVLFDANVYPDRSIVETVINSWKGPNKNELVTCVGVKNSKIEWADTFSWMDDTSIHSLIRQDVVSLPYYAVPLIVDVLKKHVPEKWKRKEFANFSYISVPVPTWAYILILVLDTGIVVGCFIFTDNQQ